MGQSPSSRYYNDNGEGMPFLQGKAEFSHKYPKATKYCSVSLKVAPVSSVLMSVRAPVGDVNVADREYIIGRGVAALTTTTGNPEYLYYVLKHFKSRVAAMGTGTTFDSVNKGTLKRFEIPMPSRTDQDRVAGALSSLDAKLDAERKRLEALTALYHSSS